MNWALIVLLLSVCGAVADLRSPVTSSTSTSTSITSDNSIAHDNSVGVTSNNIRLAASAADNFDGDDTTQLLSLLGNDEGDRTHNDPTMKGSNDAEAADAHNTTPAGQIADGSDEGEIFSCAYRGPSPADPDYKRHSDPASMSSRGTVMPGRRRMLCNAPLSPPPPSPHTRHNPSSPSRQDGPGYNEGDYEDGEGVRHSCFTMWTMVNGRQHITYQGCIGSQLEGHQSCTSHTCVATRQLWRRNTTTYYCCCATPLCNTHFSYQPASAGDGGGATMDAPPYDRHHLHTRDTASADLLVVVPLIVCCILLSLVACVGVLLLRRHHKHTTTNAGGGGGGVWRWWRVLVAKRLDAAASGGAAIGGVEDPPPPFTPTVHFDQLNMGEMIGRGRYGSVYGAVLCGRDVAVKMFPAWYRNYYCTERHIYQLPWMEHAALLKYFGGNECRRDGVSHFFLVLARAQLGTLCEFLENHVLCVDQLYRMAYTTISGLAHLHTVIQRGGVTKPALAHRDFNSRNVLVRADGSCCVCDLGFAMQLGGGCGAGGDAAEGQREQRTDTVSLTDVGTLRYMAPEVLEGAVNLRECESALKQVDMYAAALVLWELTSRCADFYQITTSCDSGGGGSGGGGDDDDVQAQPPRYQLPYQQQVGCHPTFEQMQALVVEQRCRPALNDAWQRPGAPPPLRHICRTIEDTWDSDGEARLTALCLLERLTELPILWHRYQGSSSNVLNVARSPMSPPTTTSDVISDVTSAVTSPILDERTCDTLLLSPEQQMNARNLQVSALHTHTSNQQQQHQQQQHFRPSLLRSSDNNNDSSAICAAVECQPLLAAPTVATSSGGGGHNVPSPPAL